MLLAMKNLVLGLAVCSSYWTLALGEEILAEQIGDEDVLILKSPEPKSPVFPPIPPCLDNPEFVGPNGPSCALNAPLCMVPEVMDNCMVTCQACPPILTDLPPSFGFCLTFVTLVNTQDTLALFLATCVDVSSFEVAITVDLLPITTAVTGSGGLAADWVVTGVDGIVTGVDVMNSSPIPAGTFNTLTTLTADDGSEFPSGVTCVVDLNLQNFYGQKVLAFSPCTTDNQCFTGDFTPPPPAPPPPPQIISDPHFVGFNNQRYDVTGKSGLIYSLIADESLYINAELATAYTTGLYIDPLTSEVQSYRPRGTWMTSVGIVASFADVEHQLQVTVEPGSFADVCELKPKECFKGGSVALDGIEVWSVGSFDMGDGARLSIKNMKAFGRVELYWPNLEATVDSVLPPGEWDVADADVPLYSHVNLKFQKISVSESANGIIGCTSRVRLDSHGQPILWAYDKDGAGVLDGPVSAYEVPDLLDTSFPLYSEEWVRSVNA